MSRAPVQGPLIVLRVGTASGAGTRATEGDTLHWNEEPPADRTPPRRSAIEPQGIAAEIRRRRQQEAQQPMPPVPERPRSSGTASTGQLPVARTRATPAGPTGTAPIPVVRTQPAAPQDPARRRLRVETPAEPVQPTTRREALRPAPQPQPADRRRVPAAAPDPGRPDARRLDAPTLARALAPAPQPLRPQAPVRTRPAAAPLAPVQPSRPTAGQATRSSSPAPAPAPAPRPVVRTVPPPPIAEDPEPTTSRGRRPVRGVLAALAAFGLLTVFALPSIAGETAGAPPVAGVHEDDDLQQFHVNGDVRGSGAQTDPMTGQLPVAAAPTWVVPLHGELRDGFGPRLQQPVAGVNLFHRGQDLGGGCGAQIHAAAAGTVESTGWWGTYGNWTLIDHGDGVETGYAHQARMLVRAGQHVTAGQVIGIEGTTGASTGCHLHLEVHLNGIAVNPVPFFIAKGIPLGR